MDALQAAVLRAKLFAVRGWIEARRRHAAAYDDALRDLPGRPLPPASESPGWNGAIYTIRVPADRRDALLLHLRNRGIEAVVYYREPLHLQPLLRDRGFAETLPIAEQAAREVISLPSHPFLDDGARERVIRTVREFFGA